MTEARNGCAAAGVDVPAAFGVHQEDALPTNCDWQVRRCGPMEDVTAIHCATLTV
jgi:hypothetical protein